MDNINDILDELLLTPALPPLPNNIIINDIPYNVPDNITNCKYDTSITPNTSYNSLASLNSTLTTNTNHTTNSNSTSHHSFNSYNSYTHSNSQLLYTYSTKIQQFSHSSEKLQLKDNVFISKDCTRRLGQYIVDENWGKEYGLLYKYLDYIFRCQAFKGQIIEVNDKYLIFHSGLQRKCDYELLYVLLILNKKFVDQKWRVSFGNIRNSFVSKDELLKKFSEPYIISEYLPKRTKFNDSISQLLYDETFPIEVNWEERLVTNKDRIYKVLGNLAFVDYSHNNMKLRELICAFGDALRQTQRIAQLNPRLAIAQGFVDTKHYKYRLELLLPLTIEFPKCSRNYYTFALAISKASGNVKKYIAKSLLTLNMAYANARLVGYVDSSWLYYENHCSKGKMNVSMYQK